MLFQTICATTMSEIEIIEGCIRKEAKFQRMLVVNYAPMLLTVSRRYCPANIGAKDNLQDAFIRIFNNIEKFDSNKGTLATWMRKIVINTALKKLNKKRLTQEQSTDSFQEIALEPSVYQYFDAEEIISLIMTLPEGLKQVFNLHAVEGYSHKEIGELLGIKETTSRNNLSKAKKILQTKIYHQNQRESCTKTS